MTERDAGIAELIRERIKRELPRLQRDWSTSGPTSHLVIDDALPPDLARRVFEARPAIENLALKSSLKERKKVGVSVEEWDPLMREATLALQSRPVLEATEKVTGISQLIADTTLYAAGISVMEKGDFLQPHLDNSHDGDQQLYRVLNLLYYVTPDWDPDDGGNLELWDHDVRDRVVVEARFNRLVIMMTGTKSWHSVQEVTGDVPRVCLSSYFFRERPVETSDYRHVTFFAGRPEQRWRNLILRLEGSLRGFAGKLFPRLLLNNPHRRRSEHDEGPRERQ